MNFYPALFNLQNTEIWLFLSLLIAFLILVLLIVKQSPIRKIFSEISGGGEDELQPSSPQSNILEVFDYLGTKIIHENGKYTVNHKGKVTSYENWDRLPLEFKKMVKELDARSGNTKQSGDYFLEVINGIYYLTLPNGKIKKYNRLQDVPAHIRKAVGK